MDRSETIKETRQKLDRAIELQELRGKEWVKAKKRIRTTAVKLEDQWAAELAQRRYTAAMKRVARAATFLRYLETR